MADGPAHPRRWIGRTAFAALALVLIFLRLLPLQLVPVGWAGPNLLLAVTLVWAVRRPDYLPVSMVAAVFLLADLLFQRPPGLMAAAVVMGTEFLRRRHGQLRTMPFALEWGSVALVVIGIAFGQRLVLAAAMLPQAPMAPTMVEMALTILCYPLVTGLAYMLFGVARRAPGEVDALGHRL
ncbi:rod shape-determining protein MreD [Wenxinia saemankumensis]|uniref:Rod shape-determining protein MreD n=1 Tax=Wenxinia saemankumensis TaxID=1447782 RepID=A0A1M6DYE1_9RHOB|nr:rod shape-determining protein MreD [Wenxinia saemankumensis]SHI78246.1 rod shape-determining protein MreD [Wenxinia saemankumensis]